jgi:hypothetical protein
MGRPFFVPPKSHPNTLATPKTHAGRSSLPSTKGANHDSPGQRPR